MKLKTIVKLYDELNYNNFRGRLARPVIRLCRNDYLHGKISDRGYGRCIMWIHPFKANSIRAMRATIFHEMIHQYLDYHLNIEDTSDHGDLFWLTYFIFATPNFDWEDPKEYVE